MIYIYYMIYIYASAPKTYLCLLTIITPCDFVLRQSRGDRRNLMVLQGKEVMRCYETKTVQDAFFSLLLFPAAVRQFTWQSAKHTKCQMQPTDRSSCASTHTLHCGFSTAKEDSPPGNAGSIASVL